MLSRLELFKDCMWKANTAQAWKKEALTLDTPVAWGVAGGVLSSVSFQRAVAAWNCFGCSNPVLIPQALHERGNCSMLGTQRNLWAAAAAGGARIKAPLFCPLRQSCETAP